MIFKFETRDMDTIMKDIKGECLQFNLVEGYYQEDLDVVIQKDSNFPFYAPIYYTTDGREPTESSEKYWRPIHLDATDRIMVNSIRAAVIYHGERSEIYTRTYIVGKNAVGRYTLPVVSVTGNSEDLYGYETGILVPGKLFREYARTSSENIIPDWKLPANFNQTEEVRKVNLTIFQVGGTQRVNQKAGMSITGNSSRRYEQKPLKFMAEECYDSGQNSFDGNLWKTKEISKFSKIRTFDRIKLRNGGVDFLDTMIRGSFFYELAWDAGFHETLPVQPATTYINNKYYGIADMQPVYNESYIGETYGVAKEKVEVYQGGETEVLSSAGYDKTDSMDMCNTQEREKFETLVDVENLLEYYAFEIIVGNTDWPHNNVKAWRYTGDYTEDNSYTDGRLRFLLYDLDSSFWSGEGVQDPFELLFYEEEAYELWNLLPKLLRYEPYKDRFINILMDDLSTCLSTENMSNRLVECNNAIAAELGYTKEETSFASVKGALKNRDAAIAKISEKILGRKAEVYDYLNHFFQEDTTYQLEVEAPGYGNIIKISSLSLYGGQANSITERCSGYPVTLEAVPGPGSVFSCWMINGKRTKGRSISIDGEQAVSGKVNVELITRKESPGLVMDAISAQGDKDFVVLYNASDEKINLGNYYLSDDGDQMKKYKCPDGSLEPGQKVVLNGKKNQVLGCFIMNFNLSEGEKIFLYDASANVLSDQLCVPKMNEDETYGRYMGSSDYRFFHEGQ